MEKRVEPGKWYLTLDCSSCGRVQAFADGQPPEVPVPLPTTIPLTCQFCGHSGEYRPEQVRRAQGIYKN